MEARSNAARAVALLRVSVDALTDDELLAHTRALVGRSNRLLAELLAHLAEVETRGIHRTRACSSLYTYCIYELRFSEDEAFRRVAAARLVKRFPALIDAIGAGELHLTGLLLLGPHLTETNHVEVLARAKHRTKREIAALVRVLDPLPPVPARIEPLGPAPARVVPSPATWTAFTHALRPVRELSAGERPGDWLDDTDRNDVPPAEVSGFPKAGDGHAASADSRTQPHLEPQRYGVQFTATEEYVRLVEEARALLSHAAPRVTLAEIHLRAMRTFVAELRKQKYAVTTDSEQGEADDARAMDSRPKGTSGETHAGALVGDGTDIDSPPPVIVDDAHEGRQGEVGAAQRDETYRAGAGVTSRPRSGVRSSRGTKGAAVMSRPTDGAAQRPVTSSSIM